MRKLIAAAAGIILISTAMAAQPGYYLGFQAGANKYTNISTSEIRSVYSTTDETFTNRTGAAFGFDAGYNFNKYIGLRFDFIRYPSSDLKFNYFGTPYSYENKLWSADIMAMGFYPIGHFELLGGAGFAYIQRGLQYTSRSTQYYYEFIRPKFTAGVGYDFNKHWSANLTYSMIRGAGSPIDDLRSKSYKYFQGLNTWLFTINYHFLQNPSNSHLSTTNYQHYYVGAQAGYAFMRNASANDHNTHANTTNTRIKNSNSFASGIDVGYQFNPYLGLQFDLNRLGKLSYTYTLSSTLSREETNRYQSFDMMVLGYYPIHRFQLIGGIGYALIHDDLRYYRLPNGTTTKRGYAYKQPKVTLGVGYKVSNTWSANLSYSRIFGRGTLGNYPDNYLPNLDTMMLGINYNFA